MPLLHRALTGAAATAALCAALVATATPAAAYGSEMCLHSGSTRLFTANDGDYKIWVDDMISGGFRDYHICFKAGSLAGGEFIVRQPLAGTLVPTVTPDTSDDACPRLLELQDPVQLMTRLGENLTGNPAFVCFGVADLAYRVTFTPPNPQVSTRAWLILDKGTQLTDLYCANVPDVECGDATRDYVRV